MDEILGPLAEILEGVLQADQHLMEKTKAKVFSAFITALQMKEMRVSDIPQYSQLVLNVCETLQEEVIALFDQTRHCLASGSATEDKDSMETDDCSRPRQKDQRDGVRAPWEAACASTCIQQTGAACLPTVCQALGLLSDQESSQPGGES